VLLPHYLKGRLPYPSDMSPAIQTEDRDWVARENKAREITRIRFFGEGKRKKSPLWAVPRDIDYSSKADQSVDEIHS
jgi:hypothetical protein